jgi:hypothetical protein
MSPYIVADCVDNNDVLDIDKLLDMYSVRTISHPNLHKYM